MLQATDRDSGELGRVTYRRGSNDREFPENPPFSLDQTTGRIISTMEFGAEEQDPRTFRFAVQAHDQQTNRSRILNTIDGEVIVSHFMISFCTINNLGPVVLSIISLTPLHSEWAKLY